MINNENGKVRMMAIMTVSLVRRLNEAAESQTKSRSLLIREACEQLLRQLEQRSAA